MTSEKRERPKSREVANSLKLAIAAVDRCRELLINADAEAEDLAEYDAAATAIRFTLEDWLLLHPHTAALKVQGQDHG
jgi:hypothetical protein